MLRNFTILLLIVISAALAAFGGWRLGSRRAAETNARPASERKVLFYQSPMHPWIKSDKPGNCTICGMKLVPVYEGDAAVGASGGVVVKLSALSASVTHVETAPVVRQPLRRVIRVAGQINDDDSTHRRLSAYVDARVDKLFVNYVGAEVVAGQPLASLYSRDLLVARSEYKEALKRPASPERESLLAASRQRLRRMGLTAEQIEKLPSQTGDTFDIVAPISGTVVERKVYEGQYIKEGDVLFEIGDFSKMWFVFDAYERDLAWITWGRRWKSPREACPERSSPRRLRSWIRISSWKPGPRRSAWSSTTPCPRSPESIGMSCSTNFTPMAAFTSKRSPC